MPDIGRHPFSDLDFLAEWAQTASRADLLTMAASLVDTRRLRRFPGWHFGIEEEKPTRRLRQRLALWQVAHSRRIRRPIARPWYLSTKLFNWLGNDQSRCLFVGTCLEPNEMRFVSLSLQPGMTFIDGGAHEGMYSLLASRLVGDHGRVIAVEPSCRERRRLRCNLTLNRMNNVTVSSSALGDKRGDQILHVAMDEHSGQNTFGAYIYEGVTSTARYSVPTTTLDDLARDLNINKVDFIKLDIEGAELRALCGATTILARDRPILLFEAQPASLEAQGDSFPDLVELLANNAYQLYVFDGRGMPRITTELQAEGLNMLAIHRGSKPPRQAFR